MVSMDVQVGLVGLGLMGTAMSENLASSGYTVVGYDIDGDRLAEHCARGGDYAHSPAEISERCAIVLLSLPNSGIVREVCLGSRGVATASNPAQLIVDTTTGSPEDCVRVAQALASSGVGYLDACLSGNADQAARRDLVAMVGGTTHGYQHALPVLNAIARSVQHMGSTGTGSQAKLIVNLTLGVHRMVLAEALTMGERAGISLPLLLGVLREGAAYSRAMDVWGQRMIDADYYPPASRIRQNLKDFRLILEQGQQAGSPMFLASTVTQLLGVAVATGLGDADNSAVMAVQRELAGLAGEGLPSEED